MTGAYKPFIPEILLQVSDGWKDYELLDSGDGLKLERFGPYTFIRPEPQAVWRPSLSEKKWSGAHARFITANMESGGYFQNRVTIESRWKMQYKDLKFWAGITASRHMGVFPEQASQWDWIANQVRSRPNTSRVLNLFGYTGLATLAAAQAGADVTHVDASKRVVTWGQDNLTLSNLQDRHVRWIVDDAFKFVLREGRRQKNYDGIILDPPKFGRGPNREVWEFYRLLPALLKECRKILSPDPAFIVITAYAIPSSALTIYEAVKEMMSDYDGHTTTGELVTIEKSAGRIISHALYARWEKMVSAP